MRNRNQLTCLQVHNDYQIPGGETKTAKLIGDLLEEEGVHVIRYYKSNNQFSNSGLTGKLQVGLKSIANMDTIKEISAILQNEKIDFALIHNVSPIISNSIYKVLYDNNIPIIKYIQNYNLLCLNGAFDLGNVCVRCIKNPLIGICKKCYKKSLLYTAIKAINKVELDKKYVDNISAFMPNSEYVSRKHSEFGLPKEKMHVMYNYIQGSTYYSSEEHVTYDTYLYFGRISREKGVFTVVNAFKELPKLKLIIVGSGELEEELKNEIRRNTYENIQFLGPKYGNELMKIVHDTKYVIVASEWDEPLPRTILEAYHQGTPVIGTNRGGIPEMIIEGETGFTYSSGDVNSLINVLLKVEQMDSYSYKEMRRKSFEQHKKMYSKEQYLNRFFECIEEVLGENE